MNNKLTYGEQQLLGGLSNFVCLLKKLIGQKILFQISSDDCPKNLSYIRTAKIIFGWVAFHESKCVLSLRLVEANNKISQMNFCVENSQIVLDSQSFVKINVFYDPPRKWFGIFIKKNIPVLTFSFFDSTDSISN